MKKRYLIGVALIVLVVAVSAVSAGILDIGSGDDKNTKNEETEFVIYGYSPQSVESQVSLIESDPNFYDNNQTRDWLKSLKNYVMYDTGHEYIVMERSESNNIPVIDDGTDYDKIDCNVIKCKVVEVHPLGTGLKDCILVKDVQVTGNKTIDLNSTV